MLKLVDITKEYKVEEESVLALHNLSVEFRRNEFVSILGPSGCGKTTLLNIIGGLDRYTSGDIQVEGVSTEDYDDLDWDTYRNQRIGFVFQSYNLIPHISVLKNVALSLTLAGVGKEESRERALEALRKVGLEKQAKKKPNQLSGGQMQRVAIARAIVNNPEIILADEPTGALDSESGVRVMELLKEVARDRLVIMVTHNGQLAEEYSTRIINLKDGEIIGDTMPYTEQDAADEEAAAAKYREAEEAAIKAEVDSDNPYARADRQRLAARRGLFAATYKTAEEKKNIFERIKARIKKRKIKEKSSMALSTAISLSWTNLLSKKGRTALTAFAGSIGIIGILLVLTLSNGVNAYIRTLEENALSQYPVTINENGFDISSIMQTLTNMNVESEEYPDGGVITPSKVLGNLLDSIGSFSKNDLTALKAWLDDNFDSELGTVKYDYATTLNVYATDPDKSSTDYMKVNPFMDAFADIGSDFSGMLEKYGSAIGSGWDEISDDKALLEQQYDLVGGRWPENANEVVIVVDKYNQVPDFALLMLGLKSTSDIGSLISGSDSFYTSYTVDDLLGLEYKLLADSDYYHPENGGYVSYGRALLDKATIDSLNPISIKVVGVIRPEQGVNVTSINGYVGYTHALTLELLDRVNYSAPVQAQYKAAMTAQGIEFDPNGVVDPEVINSLLNDPLQSALFSYPSQIEFPYDDPNVPNETPKEGGEVDDLKVVIGERIGADAHKVISGKGMLGVADEANPSAIRIFCRSFDSKEGVEALIARYSQESGNEIQYSDTLGMIMTFVEEMANTMANVLVGFAAISLIVSTIMIAIIIYTSVLERRKEIGVLRSLGARKKDIARVFTAESAIIGSFSGIIGVILSLVFAAIGNAVLALLVSIKGLMAPEWWHFVLMFFVSILLAVFAGFIPSHVAARKDPTVALRSE